MQRLERPAGHILGEAIIDALNLRGQMVIGVEFRLSSTELPTVVVTQVLTVNQAALVAAKLRRFKLTVDVSEHIDMVDLKPAGNEQA